MKLVAAPMQAKTHIQKTAPGPPITIAAATPAMLPTPILAPILVQNAWKEEMVCLPFFSLIPVKATLHASPSLFS